MSVAKHKSQFEYILAIDVETSGLAFGSPNPVINETTGERYQAISMGLVIAKMSNLVPLDKLYIEIQFDPSKYTWSTQAEKVHGLSQEYLKANGLTSEQALLAIVEFLEKYYGPLNLIHKLPLLGHNVATFDKCYLYELFETNGIHINMGNRHIDTFSLGSVLLGAMDSDALFGTFGLERDPAKHNALDDALFALKSAKYLKTLFNNNTGGIIE